MTAGYPGTPLPKKLGLRAGIRAAALRAPKHYARRLGPLPGLGIGSRLSPGLDFLHAFFTRSGDLEAAFPRLEQSLARDGMLWISWPRKSSPLARDLDENGVRAIGLENGLVDVKICAVDEDGSGLKFVRPVRDR